MRCWSSELRFAVRAATVVGTMLLGIASPGDAQEIGIPVWDFDPNEIDVEEGPIFQGFDVGVPGSNRISGFSFNISEPLTLTGLGTLDGGRDGLVNDIRVGLFADDLIVDATIPAGTEAKLINGFRAVEIPAFTLQPGGYVLLQTIFEGGDPVSGFTYVRRPPQLRFSSGAISVTARGRDGDPLPPSEFDILTSADFSSLLTFSAIVGPNAYFVPEPTGYFSMFGGMLLFFTLRRRRFR